MSIFANNYIFSLHNFLVIIFVILDGMCKRSKYLLELSKIGPKYNHQMIVKMSSVVVI